MRTTVDIPEREHRLFRCLAHQQGVSMSALIVDLARRGLGTAANVSETRAPYRTDPVTGLPLFSSGRPVTIEDVKALEDEE